MKVTKAILAVALVATAAFQSAEAKNFCGVDCNVDSPFRKGPRGMTKAQCHCFRGLKCLDLSFQRKDEIMAKTQEFQRLESLVTYKDLGECDSSMASFLNSPALSSDSLDHIKLKIGEKGFFTGVKVIEQRQKREKQAAEEARIKKEAELDAFFGADQKARYAELGAIGQEFTDEKSYRIQDLTAAQTRDARIKRAFAADIEARNKERDAIGAAFAAEKAARMQDLGENFNPVHHNLVVSLLKSPSHSTVIRADMGDVNFGFGFHTLAEYKAMSTNVPLQVEDEPQELLNLKRPPMAFLAAIISKGEALKPFDVMVTEDKQLIGYFNGIDFPIKVKNYTIADDILELRAAAEAEVIADEDDDEDTTEPVFHDEDTTEPVFHADEE